MSRQVGSCSTSGNPELQNLKGSPTGGSKPHGHEMGLILGVCLVLGAWHVKPPARSTDRDHGRVGQRSIAKWYQVGLDPDRRDQSPAFTPQAELRRGRPLAGDSRVPFGPSTTSGQTSLGTSEHGTAAWRPAREASPVRCCFPDPPANDSRHPRARVPGGCPPSRSATRCTRDVGR
jgi:hypothetical protein